MSSLTTSLCSCFFLVLWDHGFNVVNIEFRSCAMGRQWSHFSFPLMNSFNKTEAAIVPMQTTWMLTRGFPFSLVSCYIGSLD